MEPSSKNDFPWELVAESLTDSLTVEAEIQLQQWISSDPENKEKYLRIKEMWTSGMEDYRFYHLANEEESWKSLYSQLDKKKQEKIKLKVIQGRFFQKPEMFRNLIAIAAAFIGVIGFGIWFVLPKNNPDIIETGMNVQKKITLTDGSVITLQPLTKIEIPPHYNKSGRTIIMDTGEAYFEVVHNPEKPFVVDLGATFIQDIGTSFTILKEEKKINVAVSRGKVAFVKQATKETRELSAGKGITFDLQNESFGMIKTVESSLTSEELLNFDNTSLSEVIVSIQKVYGKKVILNDSIANKKLTAQLNGMSFEGAIKVICTSLGLEYAINDSIYILKSK
jgi:transmembrane sensor